LEFSQKDFEYKDLFSENQILKEILKRYSQSQYVEDIEKDLKAFSTKAKTTLLDDSKKAENNPPVHIKYNHMGDVIDEIKMDESWRRIGDQAALEGIVALGYENQFGESSRLHQFLKLMIFHPSSAFFSCPLAMTDGAASVLKKHSSSNVLFKKVFEHLTSRDPEKFWTSGQWMTEKTGGSDVSQTETYAVKDGGKRYRLYGTKWFTSAITSEVAMVLARTNDREAPKAELSLFLVEIRDENKKLNEIEILRLKEKLGTKAMPTAELKLNGTQAHLVGKVGEGVKEVASILNVSRLYNSVCATGSVLRLYSLAADYASKREAFGKKLIEHPLHKKILQEQEAKILACVNFVAQLSIFLGKVENQTASDIEKDVLRLFTPIAKLWTGKKSIEISSELLESFGGLGYIEDSGLPKFLRDAQVFSIWEGTTNILSLDVLRALRSDGLWENIMTFFIQEKAKLSKFPEKQKKIKQSLEELNTWLKDNSHDRESLERGSRDFAITLGELFCLTIIGSDPNLSEEQEDLLHIFSRLMS
jgi:putative acyl-CoA dehydrogenase